MPRPTVPPREVETFAGLIRWLAETHYQVPYSDLATRFGVSTALIYQWRDGRTRAPRIETLLMLCRVCALDRDRILALLDAEANRVPPRARPLPAVEATSDNQGKKPRRKFSMARPISGGSWEIRDIMSTMCRRLVRWLGVLRPLNDQDGLTESGGCA